MARNFKCYPAFVSFYFLLNILQTLFLLYLFAFLIKSCRSLSLRVVFFLSLSPVFFFFLSCSNKVLLKNPSSNLAFILNPLSGSLNHALSLLKNFYTQKGENFLFFFCFSLFSLTT